MVYSINTSAGSKLIYISSKNIPPGQFKTNLKTSFTVQLNNAITAFDTEHLFVSLYSASIPMSFYNIRTSETLLKVGVVINSIETIHDLSVSVGNYNIKQLYIALLNLFDTTINLDISKYLNFELVGQLNKTKITLINNTIGLSRINFYFNESTITQTLGFDNQLYQLDINHFIIGPKMILLFDAFSIYLRTNFQSLNNYNERGQFSDVLERIPTVDPYKVRFFTAPPTQHKLMLSQKSISSFDLFLTYDNSELVDLNGLDWECCLKVDIIKDLDRGYNIDLRNQITETDQLEI